MIKENVRILVTQKTELARLLDEIDELPILLERNGIVYRLERADERRVNRDPEKTRAAIRAGIGALDGVDVDELLADIYEARGQNSSGRPE